MSDNHDDKKILLITYHFPPSLAVGGIRMAGFAKHLPTHGWKPYVLTLDEKFIENREYSTISDLKHVKITRAPIFPSIINGYFYIKKRFKKFTSKGNTKNDSIFHENKHNKENLSAEGLNRRLKRYFISIFVTLPDAERNWIIPAIFKALRIIKNEKISVILTSGPPHSVHIIGMFIKILKNVNWIADFRDPWMTPFNKTLYSTSRLSNRIERLLERNIFKNADIVSATTEKLTHKFKEEYDGLYPSIIKFLPNGFDEQDFSALKNIKKYKTFTIGYAGSIYFGRSPEPLFRAIKELVDENRLKLIDLRVKLIGNCQFIGERLTSDVVSSYGLDEIVEISGYVPHKKALEIIKKCHVALLLAPNQPYQIPAKIYDYMGTGTKILALTGEGATADIISSTSIGKTNDPSDIQGIKDFIYSSVFNGQSQESSGEILWALYNRKNIVTNMVKQLDRILINRSL